MPKTPQFIIDMKSHPRSPKHGNRKPSPPAHGNPIDGASSRNDRADAFAWAVGYAVPRVGALYPTIDPRVVANHIAEIQRLMADWTQQVYDVTGIANLEPKPPSIPHCGIRAGEIIGWRIWWVDQSGLLRSLVKDEIFWTPGVAMKGDIEQCVHRFLFDSIRDRYAGVYCFKDQATAKMEFTSGRNDLKEHPSHADPGTVGLAFGSVKLWGEVVEHEEGYRASFAKPASLDDIYYYGAPAKDPKGLYF